MNKITPFLWFDDNAEQAVDFYLSVFPHAKKLDVLRADAAGPGKEGSVVTVAFELEGLQITALNGGPAYKLNEAFSLSVACETQDEIDTYWNKFLAAGGVELACGWIKDQFGLCWPVVPRGIAELVRHPKAMKAMMGMMKLDLAALQKATEE
jgi:predicted 3-demethylubiquinone-9 3-methyltransferase (glyoxalase superfamily)